MKVAFIIKVFVCIFCLDDFTLSLWRCWHPSWHDCSDARGCLARHGPWITVGPCHLTAGHGTDTWARRGGAGVHLLELSLEVTPRTPSPWESTDLPAAHSYYIRERGIRHIHTHTPPLAILSGREIVQKIKWNVSAELDSASKNI